MSQKWQCQGCHKPQEADDVRVYVQTQLINVNWMVKTAVRAKLPEHLHVCGDCGMAAARALEHALASRRR